MKFLLALLMLGQALSSQKGLNGLWKLRADKSDSPWEEIQKSLGKEVSYAPSSETSASWGMSSLASSASRDALERRLLRFAGALDLLTIEASRNRVQLEHHGLFRDTYLLDGRKRPKALPDGGLVDVRATREDDSITIERGTKDETTFTVSYTLEGSRLEARFHLQSAQLERPFRLRLVYERMGGVR